MGLGIEAGGKYWGKILGLIIYNLIICSAEKHNPGPRVADHQPQASPLPQDDLLDQHRLEKGQ